MDASEFNRICGILDELIKDLNILDDIFGKDLYNLLSNDVYRDGFIKHYVRKIRKEVDYNKEVDAWDRIRNITHEIDNTEWLNMRVWALLGIANNCTKEEAIKRINKGEYLDKNPTNFEGELVEDKK